jgi:hypothetical protein
MQRSNLATFLKLDKEEPDKITELEEWIKSNDPEKLKKAISELKDYPDDKLFRFAENSPSIMEFCKSNPRLNILWTTLLSEKEYPNFSIDSQDKTTYTPFQLWLGAFLKSTFDTTKNLTLLNKACEYGSFEALTTRLQMNISKFDLSNPDRQLMKSIIDDCLQLGNVYFALGYVQAAQFLWKKVNDYVKSTATNGATEPDAFAKSCYKIVLECLYRAEDLSENSTSKKLSAVVYPNKNLADAHGFDSIQDAIAKLLKVSQLTSLDIAEVKKAAGRAENSPRPI